VISLSIKEIKKREKEQRREYILDKAEKLFFSLDYDNVSMNQIAQEVGLHKATLYLYFNNKESIYFAIVLREFEFSRKYSKTRWKWVKQE
jgi:AcrR family transcriptional regulator